MHDWRGNTCSHMKWVEKLKGGNNLPKNILQGGPFGRGSPFVDIKFKILLQYKLCPTRNSMSTKGCPRLDGPHCTFIHFLGGIIRGMQSIGENLNKMHFKGALTTADRRTQRQEPLEQGCSSSKTSRHLIRTFPEGTGPPPSGSTCTPNALGSAVAARDQTSLTVAYSVIQPHGRTKPLLFGHTRNMFYKRHPIRDIDSVLEMLRDRLQLAVN